MGIDNVAIKTFNSTGSQSVCRANEADSSKLIESQFLTKCTTQYINGSGMSHIPGEAVAINSSTASTPGTASEIFYLPSDCDAISDVIYTGVSLKYIKYIKVRVGQLVVQIIYPHDIYSRNITEIGDSSIDTPSHSLTSTFSIPFIGRSNNVRNSFLQAGAVTNSMIIEIAYHQTTPATPTSTDISSTTSEICVFSHQITNTEKNFIAKNIVNRIVRTSVGNFTVPALTTSGVAIDLSSVNINVSHILIYNAADTGEISAAELILGNDRTGQINAKLLATKQNVELFSLAGSRDKWYIIKTADSAFSTAGIPFARLNNKQLVLWGDALTDVHVTVCGTQVQSTVGGAITFSA